MELVPSYGGYVCTADISKLRDRVPKRYFSNNFLDDMGSLDTTPFPEGKVPLDYALCRWLAVEEGFTFLPVTTLQMAQSPFYRDNFVRLPICFEPERLDPLEKALFGAKK